MIRAKFTCVSVSKRKGWGEHEFVFDADFSAVTTHETASSREEAYENESFFAATPAGSVKLSTIRSDLFEVGRDYYLDFTLV